MRNRWLYPMSVAVSSVFLAAFLFFTFVRLPASHALTCDLCANNCSELTAIAVPANATGVGTSCAVPDGAACNSSVTTDFNCDAGYTRSGNICVLSCVNLCSDLIPVVVPANATGVETTCSWAVTAPCNNGTVTTSWVCNAGFHVNVSGDACEPNTTCPATTIARCNLTETPIGGEDGNCMLGFSGACSYTCTAGGTWSLNSTSCVPAVDCPATTIGGCELDLTASGGIDGTCDTPTYTGTCEYSCFEGSWTQQSNLCSMAGDPCAATTVNNCDVGPSFFAEQSGTCSIGYSGTCRYICAGLDVWTPVSNTCVAGVCPLGAGTDDAACGTIDCDGMDNYVKSGTASATTTETCTYNNYTDLTSSRCEGVGDCKDPNTADCGAAATSTQISCGVCKYMTAGTCTGTTAGTCTNYPNGTNCGGTNQCDGSGNCVGVICPSGAGTDDVSCGTIDCDGLDNYVKSGTQSATTTETCTLNDYTDLTSARCEGVSDCKDPNTTDCGSAATSTQITCGTCRYMTAGTCTGTTAGTCTNYASGTDTGTCRECNGTGGEQMPADDTACGTIDCDGMDNYSKSGTASATTTETCTYNNYADLTSSRCEALGDCKDANTADCGSAATSTQITCGTCKYMTAGTCTGTTAGTCTNYPNGTNCGGTNQCDGSGNCVGVICPSGAGSDDAACGTIDCDGMDNYSKSGTASATTTETCTYNNYSDLTSSRCEAVNDCKDPNTADCGSPATSTQISCGVCKYMTAGTCTGTTAGTCTNYPNGTNCGGTNQCDGSGNCVGVICPSGAGSDDVSCGTIDCDGLDNYVKSGTQSATTTETCTYNNYTDLTTLRCEGVNDCKDPNTADCGSAATSTQITCGTCRYMTVGTCTGGTAGACTNYPNGTNCGGTNQCDGNGNCLTVICPSGAGSDDAACGTIDCDGMDNYVKSGTQSATTTETCTYNNYADLTTLRCEGVNDCKDPNTGDCGSPSSSTQITCGTCRYMTAGTCTGTTAGACTNYASGTDTGTCRECNGAGGEQMPADDTACGTIDCDGMDNYSKSGTASATTTETCTYNNYTDLTSSRCEALGDCKDANTADCGSAATSTQITCGTCKYMTSGTCTGTTAGTCTNYPNGTNCGGTNQCDGSGNCLTVLCPSGAGSDDAACGTIDCDGLDNYVKSGTQSATATETCTYNNYADLTTLRCEGVNDCKDANTADCGSPTSSTQITCGTCKYMTAGTCTGTTAGTCANYPATTDSGTCRECNGSGGEQMPADDAACGTIDCDALDTYSKTGTASATTTETCIRSDYTDLTSSRCEALGDCKDANTADCGSPSNVTQITCGLCKYMTAGTCSGGTAGTCTNYANGTNCGGTSTCQSGNCMASCPAYSYVLAGYNGPTSLTTHGGQVTLTKTNAISNGTLTCNRTITCNNGGWDYNSETCTPTCDYGYQASGTTCVAICNYRPSGIHQAAHYYAYSECASYPACPFPINISQGQLGGSCGLLKKWRHTQCSTLYREVNNICHGDPCIRGMTPNASNFNYVTFYRGIYNAVANTCDYTGSEYKQVSASGYSFIQAGPTDNMDYDPNFANPGWGLGYVYIPPPTVCGDGVVTGSEACDNGGCNGSECASCGECNMSTPCSVCSSDCSTCQVAAANCNLWQCNNYGSWDNMYMSCGTDCNSNDYNYYYPGQTVCISDPYVNATCSY